MTRGTLSIFILYPGHLTYTLKYRIRRVKCDEQKPACLRCTSTGRTCDGYGGPVPPRKKDPPAFARQKQAQASSKHEEGAHGSSFRGLRTLAADTDIPETETEPEPDGFHDVRIAPTANLPFHASDNDPAVSSFWQQDLVPQQFGSTHQAYHRHPFPDYLPGPDTSEMVLVPGEPFGLVPRCYDDLPALEQTLDSFLVENGHWMYPVSRRP